MMPDSNAYELSSLILTSIVALAIYLLFFRGGAESAAAATRSAPAVSQETVEEAASATNDNEEQEQEQQEQEPGLVLLLGVDEHLFKTCFGDDDAWLPHEIQSLSEEECTAAQLDAILTGSNADGVVPPKSVVIDQDVDHVHWNRLKRFYQHEGGQVVYFGIYGEFAAPHRIGQELGFEWRFSGYTNFRYELTKVATNILGTAITQQEYTKSNLVQVPQQDRLMVPQKAPLQEFVEDSQGIFPPEEAHLLQQEIQAVVESGEYDRYCMQLDQQCPLAMHQHNHAEGGGGRFVYLGFVNGGGNIPAIVRALLTGEKTTEPPPPEDPSAPNFITRMLMSPAERVEADNNEEPEMVDEPTEPEEPQVSTLQTHELCPNVDWSGIQRLQNDLLAHVLSFLPWPEVLQARVSCQLREAARVTPVDELFVTKRAIGLQLSAITQALSGIRGIRFDKSDSKSQDMDVLEGDNPEPVLQFHYSEFGMEEPQAIDLSPLINLKSLQRLTLRNIRLNGSYPFLFCFEHLESLDLLWNVHFKWDLSMLSSSPKLKRLYCAQNRSLTGNVKSLQHLKATLVELSLFNCEKVVGEFSDLFDFGVLKELDLEGTKVTGDIRRITANDLPLLQKLGLGEGVYGGGAEFATIDSVQEIMMARRQLMKRGDNMFSRRWRLAEDSPERYRFEGHHSREPPFWVEFVKAGPRVGFRWTNCVSGGSCETQWLDPEPQPGQEDHDDYLQDLEREQRDVNFYRGFVNPPTEQEHAERNREVPLDPFLSRQSMFHMNGPFGW